MINETIILELDIRPIGINNYQKSAKSGRRYITPEGKLYKQNLISELMKYREKFVLANMAIGWPVMVNLEMHYYFTNYYTKKGELNKNLVDVDGPNKIIIDALFECLGHDDNLLHSQSSERHPSTTKDCIIIFMSFHTDLPQRSFLSIA